VEGAPSFLPAGRDIGDVRLAEIGGNVVDVSSELDLAADLAFLEAAGETREPRRPCLLRARNRDPNRDSLQRNALFSFWKNPSSALYVSSVERRSNSSSRRRCSSVSRRGTTTLTSTR
jgi:hypothetical protein